MVISSTFTYRHLIIIKDNAILYVIAQAKGKINECSFKSRKKKIIVVMKTQRK